VLSPRRKMPIGPVVPAGAQTFPYVGILMQHLREKESKEHFLEPPTIVSADATTALTLGLETGTKLVRRYHISFADQDPARLVESYYPVALAGELLD